MTIETLVALNNNKRTLECIKRNNLKLSESALFYSYEGASSLIRLNLDPPVYFEGAFHEKAIKYGNSSTLLALHLAKTS